MQGLSHFSITLETLQLAMAQAMACGATYADFYFEDDRTTKLALTDHKVDKSVNSEDYGVGVRVVVGEKTGYAYSTSVSKETLLQTVKRARAIAEGCAYWVAPQAVELPKGRYYPQKETPFEPIHALKSYLEQIDSRIFAADSRVVKCLVSAQQEITKTLFYNSLGECYYDIAPLSILSVSVVMAQNNRYEQNHFSRMLHIDSASFYTQELMDEAVNEIVKRTSSLFDAVRPKGGEQTVVMAAGASGILLHEAIGHAFEADFIRRKESIFTDKMGQIICNEQINIVDDGTIPFNGGSINYDDEGVPSQKTYLVKDGRLNSFMHDRISAKALGAELTGNGRRASFRDMPLPRMRATYMLEGEQDEQDIIHSVKNGIYVEQFTNGQVQIGAGDFTFYVKFGYKIEDGVLTQPIKDINIIGNGPEVLAAISAVGNKTILDNSTWVCGKAGQRVNVCCGMPSVRVEKLIVGGE